MAMLHGDLDVDGLGYDNRVFDVNGRGPRALQAAIELALRQAGVARRAEPPRLWGYAVLPPHAGLDRRRGWDDAWIMALLAQEPANGRTLAGTAVTSVAFPGPLTAAEVTPLVLAWLGTVPYPEIPGIDGDEVKGWRCYVEPWGRIDGIDVVCGVTPEWILYGK